MNQQPQVSVILPTYNRSYLLSKAIESVLSQTYKNWELIVWDDGSTDNTKATIESISDKRIHYFSESNHGMSYALNKAIEKSKAEFVAFLDDDDQWTNTKLADQLNLMQQYSEIDFIFGNFYNINSEKKTKAIGFNQNSQAMRLLNVTEIGQNAFLITGNFLKSISISNFIAFDSVVIRKEILVRAGKFNEELKNGMDFEYWWRLGLLGLSPSFTQKIVLNRVKYPQSLSGSSLISLDNQIKTLDSCFKIAQTAGRYELTNYLKPLYRIVWQNKMSCLGRKKNITSVLNAFHQTLKYGFRLGSVKLLFIALFATKK